MSTATRGGLLALGLASLALTACGSDSGGGSDSATAAASSRGGPEFVFITDAPIGVNQFLRLGVEGTRAAASALGGTARVFESTADEQTRASNIEAALAEKPAAIVLITFEFDDLSLRYAKANPDQQFVLIDSCPTGTLPSNLRCGVFKEHEASYLLGVEAGLLSRRDRVGTVAAIDIPFFHRWSDSFALGARSVDPAVKDSQLFVGGDNPVNDPARSKELALATIEQGADQLFAVTGGGNGGIFEAAREAGVQAYGVDVNQCPQAPGVVVDNAIKQVDVAIKDLLEQIQNRAPGGRSNAYGLAEDGSTITSLTADADRSQCAVLDHPDVIEQVKRVRDEIVSGTLTVPDPTAAG